MSSISKLAIFYFYVAALAACIVDPATYPSDPSDGLPPVGCGNGILDPGEECDYGAQNSDSGACLTNCVRARCGDGHIYPALEQCDDGNNNTEVCEYGLTSCIVCDATCHEIPGKTSFCGDGIVDPQEMCDDANLSCGSCNSECQGLAWQPATGSITTQQPYSGDWFKLNDGFNPPLKFELVLDQSSAACDRSNSKIVIAVPDSGHDFHSFENIANCINQQSSSLLISAQAGQNIVLLSHSLATPQGYVPIVVPGKSTFQVSGMDGHAGRDCADGEPCASDEDCESERCASGVCHQSL